MGLNPSSSPDPSFTRGPLRRRLSALAIGLFLFGLALVWRVVFLLEIRSSPLFQYPIIDMYWHRLWAQEILAGDFWGREVFFRAPLYPYFLALVMAVAGSGFFWPRLLQALVGCLAPVLLRRLALGFGLSERSALAAGVIAAVYPLSVYFDTEFLIPVLIVPLDLALLLCLARRQPEDPLRAWILPGLCLGLSAIARPSILVFLPGIALWMLLILFRHNGKAWAGRLAVLAAAMLAVIAPVTLRNAVVGHDFVPIASQGGINFWIGNNPQADGKTATAAGPELPRGSYRDNVWLTSQLAAERALGRKLKPSQISDYWYQRGWEFIRQDPAAAFTLFIKKIYFLLNGAEIPCSQSIYYYRNESYLFRAWVWPDPLQFPFGVLLPLAGVGIFFSLRQRKKFLLLYLFLLTYGFGIALFFVNARFRMPLVPVLILFAVYGIQEWRQRWRDIVPPLLLAGLLALSNSHAWGVNQEDEAKPYDCMGSWFYDQGKYEEARVMYEKALAKNPRSATALNNLGTLSLIQGRAEPALNYFTEALLQAPDQPLVVNNLGLAYERLHRLLDAETAFLKAVDLDPNYEPYWNNLNRVRAALGKHPLKWRRPAPEPSPPEVSP